MEYLKVLRKQKGLKQKELGALVGCSEATISMYEAGKRSPDYETLLKLSDTLGCSVDELLRGKTELMASSELDEKRQRLVESVKDMTDDQVDLLQQLVDQILRQR